MKLDNSQNNALAKLPMLKLGEYEMWEIRIKLEYFRSGLCVMEITRRKIIIDGSSTAGYDKLKSDMAEEEIQENMALMAFSDSEVTNDKSCLNNYEALKKQYDDLLVKLDDTGFKASTYKRDWVSDDEDDVEPIPKVKKKTVIPTTTKKEFVKPETPVRRSVSCPNDYTNICSKEQLNEDWPKKLLICKGQLILLGQGDLMLLSPQHVGFGNPSNPMVHLLIFNKYNYIDARGEIQVVNGLGPPQDNSNFISFVSRAIPANDKGFVDRDAQSTCLET
ncbi:hypothetical protein Tco_0841656 [Tanacetum coccineum]|uniref:Uncharacterized protein n=1 Tax=Tanacetum coccineum TaxID=301880 RepID=A0ABQ5B2N1_9ASTR